MGKTVLSIGLALALMALAIAGPCLACQASGRSAAPANTCCDHHHGKCHKPGTAPVQARCGTTPVDTFTIDRALVQVGHADTTHAVLLQVSAAPPLALGLSPRFELPEPYSPPDLCLLHSVLTI